jgi:hypothetical protein
VQSSRLTSANIPVICTYTRPSDTPREGVGSLPSLLLNRGQQPPITPPAFPWEGVRRRNCVHETRKGRQRNYAHPRVCQPDSLSEKIMRALEVLQNT